MTADPYELSPELSRDLIQAARRVIQSWGSRDLAAAVRELSRVLDDADPFPLGEDG